MTSVGLDLWLHGGNEETDSGEGDTCSAHTVLLLLLLLLRRGRECDSLHLQ
jgi:hypothetical protein